MNLAGACAAAFGFRAGQFAGCEAYVLRAFAEGTEIEVERSGAVKGLKGSDAVANSGEEHGEFGAFDDLPVVLEFGGREKLYAEFLDYLFVGHQAEGYGFEGGLVDEVDFGAGGTEAFTG